jgi:ABC-type antimicrobial peptide transport system permease subunit
VCFGVALGLVLAASGAHLLRAFVFQIQPLDVPTLGAVAGSLLAVVVASSLRPVRRAVRLDVARILREL